MAPSFFAEAVGAAAGLCSMASFTPQVVKLWRERDAKAISLRMYALTVTGFSLWTLYGLMIASWPVVGSNAVCLTLSAAILAMKWRFAHEARQDRLNQAS